MTRFAVTLKIERPAAEPEYTTAVMPHESAERAAEAVLSVYLQARPNDAGLVSVLDSLRVN
jgi:hypothetical protein